LSARRDGIGLLTYYVLFFIHLESRRVDIAGITVHPDERWMQQKFVIQSGSDCLALLGDHPFMDR
jgi:hypothetical protein